MRRTLFIALLAAGFPAIVIAQHRAAAGLPLTAPPRVSVATAPRVAPRTFAIRPMVSVRPVARNGRAGNRMTVGPSSRAVHPKGWNNSGHRASNQPDPVFPNGNATVEGYPVPGLGFDYTHYFATHPNAGRCHHCFGNGGTGNFIGGGYYLPLPVYYYGDESAEQPPVEQIPEPEEGVQSEQPASQENANYPSPWNTIQAAPKQETEYVFVKRDGTLIFAVAYSWINDRLQYVNEEGLRRTIPANSIDLDATQQFNDQRGVPIRLPA